MRPCYWSFKNHFVNRLTNLCQYTATWGNWQRNFRGLGDGDVGESEAHRLGSAVVEETLQGFEFVGMAIIF